MQANARSGGLAWLSPLWPYQVTTANPPPASWVTLAEVSDFVLSFPWVWNWKRVPRLPSTPAISPAVSLYGYENE